MMQVIEQTHKQKMKMYMKCTKKKLAEMLIECNRILEAQLQVKNIAVQGGVSGSAFSSTTTTKKEGYYSDNWGTYYLDANGKKHLR